MERPMKKLSGVKLLLGIGEMPTSPFCNYQSAEDHERLPVELP